MKNAEFIRIFLQIWYLRGMSDGQNVTIDEALSNVELLDEGETFLLLFTNKVWNKQFNR